MKTSRILADFDRQGQRIYSIEYQGQVWPGSSRYDSRTEARRIIEHLSASQLYILPGLGNPQLITQLVLAKPDARVVILAQTGWETADMQSELESRIGRKLEVRWLAEESSDLGQIIGELYSPLLFETVQIVSTPWSGLLKRLFGWNLEELCLAAIRAIQNDFVTWSHFGSVWHHNILKNILWLGTHSLAVHPVIRGRQAVVLGAGPGLETMSGHLKTLLTEENCLLGVTDTALGYCVRVLGLQPDLVFVLDPQVHTLGHFIGLPRRAIQVCSLGANPGLWRDTPCTLLPMDHPLEHLLLGSTWQGQLPRGRNVGHEALRWLLEQGASRVYLLGMDFATIDGQDYCRECQPHRRILATLGRTSGLPLALGLAAGLHGIRSSLMQTYLEDFMVLAGQSSTPIHPIRPYADLCPPLPSGSAGWDLVQDSRPGAIPDTSRIQPALERLNQDCTAALRSIRSPGDDAFTQLASHYPQLYTGLLPLIACEFRKNLKNGRGFSDSRNMATWFSLEKTKSLTSC